MLMSSWNIRGMNDPIKQSEVSRFIFQQKVSFIGIFENKIREENVDSVCNYVAKDWQFDSNLSVAVGGRILILWNEEDLEVRVLLRTVHLMHCEIRSRAADWSCLVSVGYAAKSSEGRRSLRDSMWVIAQDTTTWLMVEDFNAVRFPNESGTWFRQLAWLDE